MSTPVYREEFLRCLDPAERAKLGPAGVTAAEACAKFDLRAEKELQQQIAQYLRLLGIWFNHDSMAHRRRGTAGCPDFLCCYKGTAIGIEAKTATGKVNAEQLDCHRAMVADGWYVLIARSLADVQELFRRIDKDGTP